MNFRWVLYANQFAHGSAQGSHQTEPYAVGYTFEEYIEVLKDAAPRVYAKGRQPHILHAITTSGLKSTDAITHYTGITLDSDAGTGTHKALKFLESWPYAYIFQSRKGKYHITIPFAKETPAFTEWGNNARTILKHFSEVIEDELDRATAGATALTGIYTRRQPQDPVPELRYRAENPITFEMLCQLAGSGLVARTKPKPREIETQGPDTELVTRFREAGLIEAWNTRKGAYEITCPHQHEVSSKAKTLLYPKAERVTCMAGNCQGRSLHWFLAALPGYKVEHALPPPRPSVTVSVAHAQITEALKQISPVDQEALVIRVTTGAGKTRAVSEFLNQYSAPDPGRTSVLATPTNALLREVEQRISVDHVRRLGVLSVLLDDGTPACRKHAIASEAQSLGVNIHRSICAPCEYRKGCPAREGTRVGRGALTITNHALMPSVAEELHTKQRYPYLVWDESPEWVSVRELSMADISWLEQQLIEDAAYRNALASVAYTRLFAEKFLLAIKPALDLAKWIIENGFTGTIGEAFKGWCKPAKRALIHSGLRALGVEPRTDYEGLVQSFKGAGKVRVDTGLDALPPGLKTRAMRAERILNAVAGVQDPETVAQALVGGVAFVGLTPNARLFKKYGGVVLDATAPLKVLELLRPGTRVLDIDVQDAKDTERLWVPRNLSRKKLAEDTRVFEEAVLEAKSLTKKKKTVGFTYKNRVSKAKAIYPEADWHHYGDVRGHDRWYRAGYEGFVTLGDPVPNVGTVRIALQHALQASSEDISTYLDQAARAETAQAHGRARDPQAPLATNTNRLHLHIGNKIPLGWHSGNTLVP